MKRARQVEYQKLQRKFRKERKDVEKLTAAVNEAERHLSGHGHPNSMFHVPAQSGSFAPTAPGSAASPKPSLSNIDGNQPETDTLDGSSEEAKGTDRVITTKKETKTTEQRCNNGPASNANSLHGIIPADNDNETPVDSSQGKEIRNCIGYLQVTLAF